MEKMSKEQITNIGNLLLSESDIIGNHGTSIDNALSIMDTGLKIRRTTMVIPKKQNLIALCTYGWKANSAGDAANVIISIPKSFFIEFLNCNEKQYYDWLNNIVGQASKEGIVYYLCNTNSTNIFIQELPKEFIRGIFIYTDNKTYLSFRNNPEKAMEHLTYIDNPTFYENLSLEEKKNFVDKIKSEKFSIESKRKNKKI